MSATLTLDGSPLNVQPEYSISRRKTIILTASPFLLAIARSIALARTLWHDGHRTAQQSHGSDTRNRAVDLAGALAETLVVSALEAEGLTPQGFEPFVIAPNPLVDFALEWRGFDVKAVPHNGSFLTVNEAKRLTYQQAGVLILPVRFTAENRAIVLRPLTAERVGRWELRQGRTPYRSIRADSLPLLRSWNELLEVDNE